VSSVGSVSVRSCISSFNNTALELYKTSLAPSNSARIFSSVNAFLKAALSLKVLDIRGVERLGVRL
jgi:hypothetical protein